jgi:hypothetical protein
MNGNFFLKGLPNKGNLKLTYSNLEISISPIDENIQELKKVKGQLDSLEEVGSLRINNATDKEESINLALTIKNLLSFALGEHIVFDRANFFIGNKTEEMKKSMVKNSNSGWQIIPDYELIKYLQETIPIWQQFSKDQQDSYHIIIDYLNQSTKGFIEDRILRVAQAWESITGFLNVEGEIPEMLLDLRNDLKTAYRKWKKKDGNNGLDQNGELGNKIVSAINQEKLLAKLFNLANQEGLDCEEINLDFRALKTLRDQVAHTGKIEIDGKEAINILLPAIKGLQIILLKKLKYTGRIIYYRDGQETIEEISKFEKKKHGV